MIKAEVYQRFGVVVGTVIVVVLLLGYKEWSLLNLVTIGAVTGATIGMVADIIDKRGMFSNLVNGFIGNIIFGATIGAIWAPKISNPMISSIAGAITGAIAGILYSKIVHYFARNRAGIDVDAIFGMLIGAIYGALIVIIYSIYMIPFYRSENISIFDIIFGDEMIFGIILGAIIGTVFGSILGIIHFTTSARTCGSDLCKYSNSRNAGWTRRRRTSADACPPRQGKARS